MCRENSLVTQVLSSPVSSRKLSQSVASFRKVELAVEDSEQSKLERHPTKETFRHHCDTTKLCESAI